MTVPDEHDEPVEFNPEFYPDDHDPDSYFDLSCDPFYIVAALEEELGYPLALS